MPGEHVDENEEYYLPLVDQRVFGAGIKRKRIHFVPAASESNPATSKQNAKNVGSRYLSIVLPKSPEEAEAESEMLTGHSASNKDDMVANPTATTKCEICGQILTEVSRQDGQHESSIAHQICEKHAHPPSHLDRTHVGLRYLREYGWDADARQGLGARGDGIRMPIKAKPKMDSTGLGLLTKHRDDDTPRARESGRKAKGEGESKLNAKEVRRIEAEKSRRANTLRQAIYGDDLSEYLGPNG